MSGTVKTVFITGCSSGIGRSCVKQFARSGYQVVATARKTEAIFDLERMSESVAGRIRATACDVASEESIQAALQFARNCFGSVDILINNAGFGLFGPVELLPLEQARYQLEVNTFGPIRLVQLVAEDMRKAGWGRIINVSSVAGRMCPPMGGWYSASKHAMEALTDALRLELKAFGIDVISIMPGPVETEFVENIQVPVRDLENVPIVYRMIGDALRARNAGERHGTVSADRVAKVILKAASARKPKIRYPITAQDKASLWMKTLLTDRAWDRLVASFYDISDAVQPKKEKSAI